MTTKTLCFCLMLFFAKNTYSQLYYNENELTIIAKGVGKTYSFYSNYVSSTLNELQSEFVLTAQFKTFTNYKDSTNNLSILKIFDPMVYPAFTLRFSPVAFNNLDRDTDNKQIITANGNLLIGNISYPISIPIEFYFMDKHLLFRLNFSIKLQNLGIILIDEYKDKLSGNLDFRIDDGHLLFKK